MKKCTTCGIERATNNFYHRKGRENHDYMCKLCRITYGKEYRKRNPRVYWNSDYKRKFGITIEDYDSLFNAQNGVCATCLAPETATRKGTLKRLAVDHCHKTGKVRGLLCSHCNMAIGLIRDNISIIDNIRKYLLCAA